MLSSDSKIETIAQLVAELRRYATLKEEYWRLGLTEKVVRLATTIVVALILTLLAFFVLAFLSLVVAFVLQDFVGRIAAFAIVMGVYLVLFVLCLLFRRQWFEAPLVRFFTGLLRD